MPCLKAASNSNSNIKGAQEKRVSLSQWNLQFICDPSLSSSSSSDPVSPPPSEGDSDIEDEEEEEEEEETDMVTALRNARAKAIAKAVKEMAIADGTYVRKPKVPKGGSVDAAASVPQVEVPYSYWTPTQVSTGGWVGLGVGGAGGGAGAAVQSPTSQDLERLQRDLEAQSFVNEGNHFIAQLQHGYCCLILQYDT